MALMHQMHADEGAGDCKLLDCDAKKYEPICRCLDIESSQGFINECALQIYNCLHGTCILLCFRDDIYMAFHWIFHRMGRSDQTEVECEVADSESATGYKNTPKQ